MSFEEPLLPRTDINLILSKLLENEIDFILVGGMAAVFYGVSTVTYDVDVCFRFESHNIQKLLKALKDIHPRVRTQLAWQELSEMPLEQLVRLDNLYLKTDCGGLDLLGGLREIGDYQKVYEHTETVKIFDFPCRVLDLDSLISIKKNIGRPKDIQVSLELEAIKEKLK